MFNLKGGHSDYINQVLNAVLRITAMQTQLVIFSFVIVVLIKSNLFHP